MGVLYLDTSAAVKRYVAESGSAWITAQSDPAAGNSCRIAALTRVELVAALYRRVRTCTLTLTQAQLAEQLFRHELSTHYRRVPIRDAILDRAMRLVVSYSLRAYDALQLASALHVRDSLQTHRLQPPIFISADQILNQAALAEGLPVEDPNQHP